MYFLQKLNIIVNNFDIQNSYISLFKKKKLKDNKVVGNYIFARNTDNIKKQVNTSSESKIFKRKKIITIQKIKQIQNQIYLIVTSKLHNNTKHPQKEIMKNRGNKRKQKIQNVISGTTTLDQTQKHQNQYINSQSPQNQLQIQGQNKGQQMKTQNQVMFEEIEKNKRKYSEMIQRQKQKWQQQMIYNNHNMQDINIQNVKDQYDDDLIEEYGEYDDGYYDDDNPYDEQQQEESHQSTSNQGNNTI